MASTLGKRKRKSDKGTFEIGRASKNANSTSEEDVQDVFKHYFEAHFKPLAATTKKPVEVVEDIPSTDESSDSEWDGISEEENQVEVIEHTAVQSTSIMSKGELKAFMSSKPPVDHSPSKLSSSKSVPIPDEDDLTESANLKKDLALQRLLAESHLLDSASGSSLTGNNRHRATDLRLQAMGAKTSILKQEKMPMSHRKGIVAKQNEYEERRRREARENGIILEKAKMGTKTSGERKRERGVGGPGVGKFMGGTLKLNKRDIFDIEGPKRKPTTRGRGGGSKRRGNSRLSQR